MIYNNIEEAPSPAEKNEVDVMTDNNTEAAPSPAEKNEVDVERDTNASETKM